MTDRPHTAVDAVLLDPRRGIVMVRRRNDPFRGMLALPGGFVHYDETTEGACVREVQEETGLVVRVESLSLIGVYSDPRRDPRGHVVSAAYFVEVDSSGAHAGSDAAAVELVCDWKNQDVAFDHYRILQDAEKRFPQMAAVNLPESRLAS
ncbi:MAG: NUDIX hydrolase [Alphaproteobacteria bacterium]|nr:NUDIX hydrolase [Alphaproteobacteria bacterium]